MFTTSQIQNGFNFTWAEPPGTLPTFFAYSLGCVPMLEGLETPNAVHTEPSVTAASITGMEDGASYECSVVSRVEGYTSRPSTIVVRTPEIGEKFKHSMFSMTSLSLSLSLSPSLSLQLPQLLLSHSCLPARA